MFFQSQSKTRLVTALAMCIMISKSFQVTLNAVFWNENFFLFEIQRCIQNHVKYLKWSFLQIIDYFCIKILFQISTRVLNTPIKNEEITELINVSFTGTCVKNRISGHNLKRSMIRKNHQVHLVTSFHAIDLSIISENRKTEPFLCFQGVQK